MIGTDAEVTCRALSPLRRLVRKFEELAEEFFSYIRAAAWFRNGSDKKGTTSQPPTARVEDQYPGL
jgi:hypothetical protein